MIVNSGHSPCSMLIIAIFILWMYPSLLLMVKNFFFNLTPAPPPTRPLDALFFNNHSTCQNFQVVHLQHWTNVPLKRSSVIDLWLISVLSVYCMSDLTVYLNRWENLQYVEKKLCQLEHYWWSCGSEKYYQCQNFEEVRLPAAWDLPK